MGDINPRFGRLIRERREQLGVTLRRFAGTVGMSPTYLSKIERSEFPPPSEQKIKLIASELGLDPDQLLAMAGKVSTDVSIIIQKKPKELASFLRAASALPKGELARLLKQFGRGTRK